MKKIKDWPLLGILGIGLISRLLFLALRPTHFDEGIDGWWVDQMITNGFYSYDPLNYHGPFPFYFEFASKLLFGRNLWALRIPSVCFGMGSIYVLTRLKEFLGKPTAYGAALLMAVSPAMVFYSRYTPHEIGLLFFSVVSCYGYLRYVEKKDRTSLFCLGLGIAGMATTKETFIVNMVCFMLAVFTLKIYESVFKIRPAIEANPLKSKFTAKDLFDATLVSVLFFCIFYSGFFMHGEGILDFFKAFSSWAKTGTKGSGHDKPFWYWLENFKRYEIASFIGLVWCLKVLDPLWAPTTRQAHWVRLFSIWGLGTLLAYSIIPYKTPWCIIQLLWPFYIVLAAGVSEIAGYGKSAKIVVLGAFFILVIAEGALASRLTFFHSSDETEPYVYVQTFPEIESVMEKLKALVKEDVNNYYLNIKVFKEDTWPIPWLLADFPRVDWLSHSGFTNPDAPLIMADLSVRGQIEANLTRSYIYMIFRMRSSQDESIFYFDADKFGKFFDKTAPAFRPPPKSPVKMAPGVEVSK